MRKLLLILAISCIAFGCTPPEYDTFGTIYGVVSDNTTGQPLANASVLLSPTGVTKLTGNDGYFEFNDLTPQQYTLTVQKTGYSTNRKSVTAIIGESVEANITLIK